MASDNGSAAVSLDEAQRLRDLRRQKILAGGKDRLAKISGSPSVNDAASESSEIRPPRSEVGEQGSRVYLL